MRIVKGSKPKSKSSNNPAVLKAALDYAKRGWAVFPCYAAKEDGFCTCADPECDRDAGKHPRTANGYKDASADPKQIHRWFGPKALPSNLAIATGKLSGITVLDIDTGEDKVEAETWAVLIEKKGEPDTLMAETGGGGMHVVCAYCEAMDAAGSKGTNYLGTHVDVKNDGGYVIAAPSRHKSGGVYKWLNWGTAVTPVPPHLQQRRGEEKHGRGRPNKDDWTRRKTFTMPEVLKALFNRCRDWKLFEGENPVATVKFTKEPRQRLRFLEPEEEAALLAVSAEPLRTLILVGIHCGLRLRSEALTLRWLDVDLGRRTVTVSAAYAKSGQTRTVPLNSVVRAALDRLPRTGEFVFAKPNGIPYISVRNFVTACRLAKLTDVTPHTLRHTFATRLIAGGTDLRMVQELGGWAKIEMLVRYGHVTTARKAEAVERLANQSSTSEKLRIV